MSLELLGLGTAVPDGVLSQAEAARLSEALCVDERDRRRSRLAYRRAGIDRRASVLVTRDADTGEAQQSFHPPQRELDERGRSTAERMSRFERDAPPLAARAARAALADAGLDASAVTQLVLVTCTGFFAPGLDARLIEELGLSRRVGRSQVGFQGCHGALNGLRVARGLSAAEPQSVVLLVAVELCSLHARHGWDAERSVANALFADGAAAVVARAGAGGSCRLVDSASVLLPDSAEVLEWRIGDHGFDMSLSPRLPALIEGQLGGWVDEWLGHRGLTRREVGSWAIHPGGPRVLEAAARALELPDAALAPSRRVLAENGNMSSPTLLFILARLRAENAPGPWVALGFGPGLTVEAALLRTDSG